MNVEKTNSCIMQITLPWHHSKKEDVCMISFEIVDLVTVSDLGSWVWSSVGSRWNTLPSCSSCQAPRHTSVVLRRPIHVIKGKEKSKNENQIKVADPKREQQPYAYLLCPRIGPDTPARDTTLYRYSSLSSLRGQLLHLAWKCSSSCQKERSQVFLP